MKNIKVTMLGILGLVATLASCNVSYGANAYTQKCKVNARYGNLTSVIRADGNIFDFYDYTQSFKAGDEIFVTFSDNGTINVVDDKIIGVSV